MTITTAIITAAAAAGFIMSRTIPATAITAPALGIMAAVTVIVAIIAMAARTGTAIGITTVIVVTVIIAATIAATGAISRKTLKRLRILRLRSSNPIPAGAMAGADKIAAAAAFTRMAAAVAATGPITPPAADRRGASVIPARLTILFDGTD